jgi:cyclin C
MSLGMTAAEINAALSLPSPPNASSEFLASFQVSLPLLMACVQDIIVLYPIWEKFEPSGVIKGKQPVEDSATKAKAKEIKFGPEDAETLVKRMVDERMRDIAAGETKEQIIGKKRSRLTTA